MHFITILLLLSYIPFIDASHLMKITPPSRYTYDVFNNYNQEKLSTPHDIMQPNQPATHQQIPVEIKSSMKEQAQSKAIKQKQEQKAFEQKQPIYDTTSKSNAELIFKTNFQPENPLANLSRTEQKSGIVIENKGIQRNSLTLAPEKPYQHPEQMEASLEEYTKKISNEINKEYPRMQIVLPKNFIPSLATMYIIDKSQAPLGYRKVQLTEINSELLTSIDWHKAKPSALEKFAAGVDELQPMLKQKIINNSIPYNPNFKNTTSMSASIQTYITELQKNPEFQNVSPIILEQYVFAVLEDSWSGQPKFRGMLGSWPILTPQDVAAYIPGKKETWPEEINREGDYIGRPTSSQKIYAMIEAIQEIPQLAIQETAKEIQLSRYGQATQTIGNVPYDFLSYAKQQAYQFGMNWLKNNQPELYTQIEPIINSNDPTNAFKKTIIQNILTRDRTKSTSPSFFDAEDLQNLEQILRQETHDLLTTATPQITKALNEFLPDYRETKQEQDVFIDPSKDIIENYLKDKKLETKIKSALDQIATPTMKEYFINSFKDTAQSIKKSPKKLNQFMKKITDSYATIMGLSKEETALIDKASQEEVTLLMKNKDSWFNAEPKDFEGKFKKWIGEFVDKMYTFIGKANPKDIQITQVQAKSNNPLTPQVTLSYNTKTQTITAAEITYKGNRYNLDLKDPRNAFSYNPITEIYSLQTPLYSTALDKGVLDSMNNAAYNSLVSNLVFNPLRATQAGKDLGTAQINDWESYLTANPTMKEGVLSIEYDPKTNYIKTVIDKTMPDTSQIQTTKTYSKNSINGEIQTTQIIKINGKVTDIYAPTTTISYTPSEKIGGKEQLSFKVDYKDPITKKVYEFTQTTPTLSENGTYTIIATPKLQAQPTGDAALIMDFFNQALSKITNTAYRSYIESIETTISGAALKQQYPQAYESTKQWFLGNYGTGIEKVVIEYNPTENLVATRVFNTMAHTNPIPTTLIYPIS